MGGGSAMLPDVNSQLSQNLPIGGNEYSSYQGTPWDRRWGAVCTLLVAPLPPVPPQPSEWASLRGRSDAPTARAGSGTVRKCPQPQSVPVRAAHPSRASQLLLPLGKPRTSGPPRSQRVLGGRHCVPACGLCQSRHLGGHA